MFAALKTPTLLRLKLKIKKSQEILLKNLKVPIKISNKKIMIYLKSEAQSILVDLNM